MPSRTISVIGGSDSNQSNLELAERVGAEIAKRGAILVCGGLGGIMEAACKGAKLEGGQTLGIIPSDAKEHANEFVDIVIPTGIGYLRNILVARAGCSNSSGWISRHSQRDCHCLVFRQTNHITCSNRRLGC